MTLDEGIGQLDAQRSNGRKGRPSKTGHSSQYRPLYCEEPHGQRFRSDVG